MRNTGAAGGRYPHLFVDPTNPFVDWNRLLGGRRRSRVQDEAVGLQIEEKWGLYDHSVGQIARHAYAGRQKVRHVSQANHVVSLLSDV